MRCSRSTLRVVRDSPGVWVSTIEAPVTAAALAKLLAQVPPRSVLTEVLLDPDGDLFATFEIQQVAPIE